MRLLAIDMDGTCLNDKKKISEETLSALRECAAKGLLVVPTTGRAATCIPNQLKNETFYRYLISSNGARVIDTKRGEVLYRAELPWERALALLKACKETKIGVSIHLNNRFILQGKPLSVLGHLSYGRDADSTECVKDAAALLEREKCDLEEIQLFYFSPSAKAQAERILRKFPEFKHASDEHYVEIYAPNASKGNALNALREHLLIPREEIACVGDGENDLSMFAAAGLRFAMGNAIPALKEQADVILPTNNESGVAQAARTYLQK